MTEGHFTKLSDSYTFEAMKSVLGDFASRIKESVKTGGSSSSSDPKPCKTSFQSPGTATKFMFHVTDLMVYYCGLKLNVGLQYSIIMALPLVH